MDLIRDLRHRGRRELVPLVRSEVAYASRSASVRVTRTSAHPRARSTPGPRCPARNVVALRADQRKDITLTAVLAHQGRRQTRRRRDCRSAVMRNTGAGNRWTSSYTTRPQSRESNSSRCRYSPLVSAGHDLVRRDRDRADLLLLTGVLADLVLGQRRALHEFALPLPPRDGIGHQDQRGRLGVRHGRRAHQRFTRATRQNHHARAARPEGLRRLALVVAQVPACSSRSMGCASPST